MGFAYYSLEEYRDCLKKLGDIGKILGGNRASSSAFNQLKEEPTSILDVGCGGGYFTTLLAKKYPTALVVGVDYSKDAIDFANETEASKNLSNLKFKKTETLELQIEEKSFDIITATLVCHHMSDNQLIDFLERAKNIGKKAIILNDLHRHKLAYYSYYAISSLLFQNRLISHDGLISITRGFTKKEWLSLLNKAGFKKENYTIKWKFPFRWIVTINL